MALGRAVQLLPAEPLELLQFSEGRFGTRHHLSRLGFVMALYCYLFGILFFFFKSQKLLLFCALLIILFLYKWCILNYFSSFTVFFLPWERGNGVAGGVMSPWARPGCLIRNTAVPSS